MGHPDSRVRLRALVLHELRALPRNTFALGAVAAVLALLALPIAGLMVGEAGLDEALFMTWLLLPLVVAILVAARVAGARRTRFVDSLYTTPLTQQTWLAAQAIVGLILGLLTLLVQLPFLVVFVAWLGVPGYLGGAALAALAIVAFAVALGLFCGVIVGDSSPLAAAGLAGGVAFVAFVMFLGHSIALSEPPSGTRDMWLRVTALSPLALAGDAAGLSIGNAVPADAWQPILGLAGMTAGLAIAAWLAYTRGQTPLGWEPRTGRAGLVAVIAVAALAIVAPLASAETEFVASGSPAMYEPGESTWIALVKPGATIAAEPFAPDKIHAAAPLPLGEDVRYDVLVLVLSPPDAALRSVFIDVKGSENVRVVAGGTLRVPDGKSTFQAPAPNDGHPRPVYRVPVTLRAVDADDLGNSLEPIEVHTTFNAGGKTLASTGRTHVAAEVPWAFAQLIAAGLVLPSASLLALVQRTRSTR